jgi:hypothetical protein
MAAYRSVRGRSVFRFTSGEAHHRRVPVTVTRCGTSSSANQRAALPAVMTAPGTVGLAAGVVELGTEQCFVNPFQPIDLLDGSRRAVARRERGATEQLSPPRAPAHAAGVGSSAPPGRAVDTIQRRPA